MKQRLFNYAATASLVLFVLGAMLWIRSYWFYDNIGWRSEGWTDSLHETFFSACLSPINGEFMWNLNWSTDDFTKSENPKIDASRYALRHPAHSEFVFRRLINGTSLNPAAVHWMGFGYYGGGGVYDLIYTFNERDYSAPGWVVVLIFAILPAIWCWRFIARRRMERAGLCWNCGYDLRATPKRCPECGAVAARSPVL